MHTAAAYNKSFTPFFCACGSAITIPTHQGAYAWSPIVTQLLYINKNVRPVLAHACTAWTCLTPLPLSHYLHQPVEMMCNELADNFDYYLQKHPFTKKHREQRSYIHRDNCSIREPELFQTTGTKK